MELFARRPTNSRRLGRILGIAGIGAIWILLLATVAVFVCAYGMYADIKAPAGNRLVTGTWAEAVAQEIYLEDYTPNWAGQPESAEFDPQLLYVPKPGVSHFRGPEFETTIHITPNRVRSQPIPPFVVIAGDSYAFGWGVQDDETFSAILQRQYGYHTVNSGVPSYGTARELSRLRRMGLLTHIDALVIQYCDNDLTENDAFIKNPSYFSYERDLRREWTEIRSHQPRSFSFWTVAGDFAGVLRRRIDAFGVPYGVHSILVEKPVQFGATSIRRAGLGRRMAKDFLTVIDHFPELKDVPIVVTAMTGRGARMGFTAALASLAKGHPNIIPMSCRFEPVDFYRYDGHLTAHGHLTVASQLDGALRQALAAHPRRDDVAGLHPGY